MKDYQYSLIKFSEFIRRLAPSFSQIDKEKQRGIKKYVRLTFKETVGEEEFERWAMINADFKSFGIPEELEAEARKTIEKKLREFGDADLLE